MPDRIDDILGLPFLVVHWAVAIESPRGKYPRLTPPRTVVEVSDSPISPQLGGWMMFACGRHWLAVEGIIRDGKLVDSTGTSWAYDWCAACQSAVAPRGPHSGNHD